MRRKNYNFVAQKGNIPVLLIYNSTSREINEWSNFLNLQVDVDVVAP